MALGGGSMALGGGSLALGGGSMALGGGSLALGGGSMTLGGGSMAQQNEGMAPRPAKNASRGGTLDMPNSEHGHFGACHIGTSTIRDRTTSLFQVTMYSQFARKVGPSPNSALICYYFIHSVYHCLG